jgi:hypothetical protein
MGPGVRKSELRYNLAIGLCGELPAANEQRRCF